MKTTLNLDDELLRTAKRWAAAQGTTLTKVIEDALRDRLAAPTPGRPFKLRFPTVKGDRPPAVDPSDRDALYEAMEGRGGPAAR